jgi:hypothetical protein
VKGSVSRAIAALIGWSCVASCAPPLAVQATQPSAGRREQVRATGSPSPHPWPRREVLDLAVQAYRCGRTLGYIERPLLTVIDYSLPSTERRLWVVDLVRKRVLFHELVAHGQNSGDNMAVAFSNRTGSRQSSVGLFRADETYEGQHGISLRLTGLEAGINDRARDRAIVMHGASYVSEAYAAMHGRLGRSWGCPAVSADVHTRLIDRIRDGSAVFAYYPDRNWLENSPFLHCAALARADRDPR